MINPYQWVGLAETYGIFGVATLFIIREFNEWMLLNGGIKKTRTDWIKRFATVVVWPLVLIVMLILFLQLRSKKKSSVEATPKDISALATLFQRPQKLIRSALANQQGTIAGTISEESAIHLLGREVQCASCYHIGRVTYNSLYRIANDASVPIWSVSKKVLLEPTKIGSTGTKRASEEIRKTNLHVCDLNSHYAPFE
jgi:hypothetical protein